MSTESRVKRVIIRSLCLDPETIFTSKAEIIKDLGADSLDAVELTMKLEEEFGIEIPDAEAEKVVTVGDVVRVIDEIMEGDA